jgi:glycosyltransferase involved in cell wall biosynthesis
MLFAVIPCYNAELTLPKLLQELHDFIPSERIVCINDGSCDKTISVLKKAGVQAYHFPRNQGKGSALKLGFRLALEHGATSVLVIDSDHQHLPADIPKFIAALGDFDIIIGSRRRNKKFGSPMPLPRIFSNTITSEILTRLTKQTILDAQCGFRLATRHCIETVLPYCQETGFMFETEFLIHAARIGFKIGFVEIEVIYGTARSNMRYVADTFNFIKLVAQHWFK